MECIFYDRTYLTGGHVLLEFMFYGRISLNVRHVVEGHVFLNDIL